MVSVKICVIFNPSARGNKAGKLVHRISSLGGGAELRPSSGPGSATKLASEAVQAGFDTVVAAGGDGTVNEVLNGLTADPTKLQRVSLGVLPLGTINVFARELGLPSSFDLAWKTVLEAKTVEIDLPYVKFFKSGIQRLQHFAQLAGAGLDAGAIELVSWELKKRVGPAAYVVAGLQALTRCNYRIEVSDGSKSAIGQLALIGNGQLYGGNFKILSPAHLQDGLLTACVFEKVGLKSLAQFSSWSFTQKGPIPGVQYFQGRTLFLGSGGRTPLEVDGENIGYLPAEFGIDKEKLRVIVPAKSTKFGEAVRKAP